MENKNYCDNCGEKVSQKTKPRNVAKDEKIKKRLLHVLSSLSILMLFDLLLIFSFGGGI